MKAVRCSDDTYQKLLEYAGEHRLSIAQAVDRFVLDWPGDESLAGADLGAVVGVVLREELRRFLGDSDQLRGGVAAWLKGVFNLTLTTDRDIVRICQRLDVEPCDRLGQSE